MFATKNRLITTTTALLLAAPLVGQEQGGEVSPVTEVGPAGATDGAPVRVTVFGPGADVPAPSSRVIDLAICLDTSGSMRGLIDSARQKIWSIVNDLALAEPEPVLRVALLAYGGSSYPAETGYVRIEAPLTRDLDVVSQKLFALVADGSVEYVGRVVDTSTRTLEWSTEPGALKMIVVAGNESADQDREVPFRAACARAIGMDVLVNAIYCGPETDEIAPGWREVARLADGQFASIDKDQGTVVVATPFDEALGRLSASINETYVPYGQTGMWNRDNQLAQDRNVQELNSEAVATRAQLKGGKLYCNEHWDLVDACRAEDFDLTKIAKEDLPEALRALTTEELKAHVEAQTKRRAEIQTEIAALAAKRDAFVQDALRELDDTRSFDFAVRKAVREQACERGFRFADANAPAGTAAESEATQGAGAQPAAPRASWRPW